MVQFFISQFHLKKSLLTCSKIFQRRQWQPTPVLLPGKSLGWRSLVGCSPWGCYESGLTERLHFHFSLSRIGEGNGNPLQCSCPENPRDGGAWWAAVYGVAQSWTWLNRLSSSSSKIFGWSAPSLTKLSPLSSQAGCLQCWLPADGSGFSPSRGACLLSPSTAGGTAVVC